MEEEDATSTCMRAPADWAPALAGWSVADTVSWLHSLPPALQQQLQARLPVGGGPPPPPWDAAAGSVSDLLTELGSARGPVLLRTDMAAGHGGASGRFKAWRDNARQDAFILWALGRDAV